MSLKVKNLVIVRAGDNSLHPFWMSGEKRNWELFVSYYGKLSGTYKGSYDYFHRFKGSKWEGVADLMHHHKDLIQAYDNIWIPDDDILTDCKTINRFFDLHNYFGFGISQPALTLGSYLSHYITLRHHFSAARETNFVEIMMPCFSKASFNLVVHTFSENSSGWGLEWLWSDISKHNNISLGIVDSTPMFHTRPVGSAGHGGAACPRSEMANLLNKYNLDKHSLRNIRFYDHKNKEMPMWTPIAASILINRLLLLLRKVDSHFRRSLLR